MKGKTVCYHHGGCSKGALSYARSAGGFYSYSVRASLREKIDLAASRENPLDTCDELALDRALLTEFMAGLVEGVPISAQILETITNITDKIVRKAVAMIRARNETALTLIEIRAIVRAMERLVDEYVDTERRGAFLADCRKLLPGSTLDGN